MYQQGFNVWLVIGIGALIYISAILITIIFYRRRKVRQLREWHVDYYQKGGLIRALMSRWRGQPRLVDRSMERSEASETIIEPGRPGRKK